MLTAIVVTGRTVIVAGPRIWNSMQRERTEEFSIFLVDDHPVVAAGLRLALKQKPNCTFLGAENRPASALPVIAAQKPDALILDLAFDGQVHLSFVRQCRKLLPAAAIVVFSSLPVRAYKPEALAAGADSFVSKATDLETLVELLAELFASPRRRSSASMDGGSPLVEGLFGVEQGVRLTPRERDVARLLSRGTSISEIAKAIGVSVKTAAAHRENLRRKLECQDSSALIARLAHMYNVDDER